ncbi:MAG: baseplate J/gp47 family protein [Thermoplasmata archaeon]
MTYTRKPYSQMVEEILKEITSRGPITDINVGSVTRTIVESIAREMDFMYAELDHVYEAGFVDTASGKSLDLVVSILGIKRKSEQYATGSVTFSRQSTAKDVVIPRGTKVQTASEDPSKVVVFETTMKATMAKGVKAVEVGIRALEPGEKGVVGSETITVIPKPIEGVESVTNRRPTTYGTNRETDAQLRERAKGALAAAGKTTMDALRNAVLNIDGVKNVVVKDMPNNIPGEVDLIVDGLDISDKSGLAYQEVRDVVDRTRAAGIKVNIMGTEPIQVYIEIYVRLTDKIRNDEEVESVVESIKDAISAYINKLSAGDDILYNRIVSKILAIDEVYNVDDIVFSTKRFDESRGGLVDDTRKRYNYDTKNLTFGPYEKPQLASVEVVTQFTLRVIMPVYVDVNVKVKVVDVAVNKEALEESIENTIRMYLERLRAGNDVEYEKVLNLVRHVPGVASVEELTISAIHEATGVMVSDSRRNITISDKEEARMRRLSLEVMQE